MPGGRAAYGAWWEAYEQAGAQETDRVARDETPTESEVNG